MDYQVKQAKMHIKIICCDNNNTIKRLRSEIEELVNKNSMIIDIFNNGFNYSMKK